MIQLPAEHDDAPPFIETVERVVRGMLLTVRPAQVFVVKIDQWFDFKWRAFSCKLGGAVGFWHRRLTLPPFHPNRVAWQRHHSWDPSESAYRFDGEGRRLHVRQWSEWNKRRLVANERFADSALVWYSGATARNDRGCLMAYYHKPAAGDPRHLWTPNWYASLRVDGDDRWRLGRLSNIGARELTAFEALGSSQDALAAP